MRDYEDRQADRDIVDLTAGRKDNSSTDLDNLVTWFMTFGAKVEVLEPAEARDMIRRNAEETLQIYKED